jgi:hypothetical protein
MEPHGFVKVAENDEIAMRLAPKTVRHDPTVCDLIGAECVSKFVRDLKWRHCDGEKQNGRHGKK